MKYTSSSCNNAAGISKEMLSFHVCLPARYQEATLLDGQDISYLGRKAGVDDQRDRRAAAADINF